MKAFRRISIPIAGFIIIFTCLSHPALATEYPGSFVEWTGYGIFTGDIVVPDAGTVSNVSLFIRNAYTYQGFNNNAMLLTSPIGTTIYLFDLSTYSITGKSLYLTRLIDTAPVIITEGIPPYAGSFRPGESFSNYNGEWMTGTWTLAVYNNALSTSNNGAVTNWSLIINEPPAPTPAPTPEGFVYKEYKGTSFSWTGISTRLSDLSIAASGVIADVNVNMNAVCTTSLDSLGMYLISPEGTIVGLFNKHDLDETTLYLTTFDDAADQSIKNGLAPYIGLYRPVESLALFNNQSVTGEWTLVAYNDDAGNNGTVSAWSLVIGIRDYVSPTPTTTPTPLPPATATPIGYKTPSPTPFGYHTPTPAPNPCYDVIVENVNEVPYVGVGITESKIYIPDNFLIKDVDVEFSAWVDNPLGEGCGTLNTKALYLTAPNNVIVELFGKHDLEEQGLYLTYFDDDAAIPIVDDIAPYYGPHQPVPPGLDKFRQEGTWSRGTWVLSWYDDCAADLGTIEHFTLCLNRPNLTPSPTIVPSATPASPTPPTPTPAPTSPVVTCETYSGSFFSWTGGAVALDTITVADIGTVDHVLLHITELYCATGLEYVGMYLLAPAATPVPMFEKHDLNEHQLYLTTFRGDAGNLITTGIAPYIGSYLPVGNLGALSGKQITGDWTLVVYNDEPTNDGYVTDWDLEICYVAGVPITPTPTTPPPTTPTPPGGMPIPVLESGDYDGDGTSDIGIFRPSLGQWLVRGVGTSWFGQSGDIPASGDYDGDGTTDIAIFRSSNGLWAVSAVTRVYFGSGDISIPGDYDGDGVADIAIYRKSSGLWVVKGITRRYFGTSTDYPVPADYDGDWATDLAVFRPSMGLWAVYGVTRAYFGNQTDLPVPRDYDGDGTDDIGIVRFSTGLWAIRGGGHFYFGTTGDIPVPADYRGNGIDYPGIFRRATALWAIKGVTRAYCGKSGDIPIAK